MITTVTSRKLIASETGTKVQKRQLMTGYFYVTNLPQEALVVIKLIQTPDQNKQLEKGGSIFTKIV